MSAFRPPRSRGWCPSGAARGLALALLPALLAGCGLKTAPRPISGLAPVPSDLRVRQFDENVLVSWRDIGNETADRYGGLVEYVLWIEELAPGCLSCPALSRRELTLRRDDVETISVEGGHLFYEFRPERPESGWRAWVAYRFDDGMGRPAVAVSMPGLSSIPRPALRWEWITPPVAAGATRDAEVRLAWEPLQERVVRVMAPGRPPEERVLTYRANLYRREPNVPWPHVPLNGTPLAAAVFSDQPSRSLLQRSGSVFEYALRRVDRIGGEGPLSEPVRVVYVSSPGTQ